MDSIKPDSVSWIFSGNGRKERIPAEYSIDESGRIVARTPEVLPDWVLSMRLEITTNCMEGEGENGNTSN